MNYKKIIKDLKEFNSQLKGQYRDEQNRNYCLQCKIDKLEKEKQELIEYLKNQINECPLMGNDEVDMFYTGKMRAFQQVLSKIEKR